MISRDGKCCDFIAKKKKNGIKNYTINTLYGNYFT